MKKTLMFFATFICFSNLLFSQTTINPNWQWGNSFDGKVTSMIKNGNYLYVTGNYQNTAMAMTGLPNVGYTDVFVMKTDTLGNVLWAKSIAGSANDTSVRILQNASGHLFIAGTFTSSVLHVGTSSITNVGGRDMFVCEMDTIGNVIALTNYGTSANDNLNDFCMDANNQLYFQKSNGLVVYSSTGSLLWQKTIANGINIQYSPNDNAVYISGLFQGTMTLGTLSISSYTGIYGVTADVFVTKIDNTGNVAWLQNITNSNRGEYTVVSHFHSGSNTLLVAYNRMQLSLDGLGTLSQVSSLGISTNLHYFVSDMIYSMNTKSNIVSLQSAEYNNFLGGVLLFDLTNTSYSVRYTEESTNRAHIYDGPNSIYCGGFFQPSATTVTLGKLGIDCMFPGGLKATTPLPQQAVLQWTSMNSAMSYNIQYRQVNTTNWTTVTGVTGSTYTINGLVAGVTYEAQIAALCSSTPTSFSPSVTFTTLSCNLTPPAVLTMSYIGATSATFLWSAVPGAASYNIRYRPIVMPLSTWINVYNIPTNSHTETGLSSTTQYEYAVSVNCSNGTTSSFSNIKQFTTQPICGNPTGLTMTYIGNTSGTCKWTAVAGALSYELRYKTTSSSGPWTTISNITTNIYSLTNLNSGTSYDWEVKALCSLGNSAFMPKTFTTLSSCAVPTGLTLTSWADNYGATKWTAVAGAISYDLQYKATSSSTWIPVMGLTSNAYWIASLSPATQYEFQVRTNCGSNSSTYSASKLFTTNALCHSTYDNNTNNTSTGAAAIPLLTPIKGSINSTTDIDYYKFSITNSANLYISLTTLPADYDLTIYNASMTQMANSANTGTASEYIMLPSPSTGTYYAKVVGVSGANSSTQCYTLKVNNNGTYLKPIDEESIEREASIEPIVFPNPTTGELNIQFTAKEASNYQVRVMDLAGKQIYASGEQTAYIGEQTHTLRLGDYSIAEGVYIVVTTMGEQRYFQRVVYRK